MPITYLAHPVRGGVHIAYDDDEVRRFEADGWVSHGTTHPAKGGKPVQPQPVVVKPAHEEYRMPDEPARRVKRGPGRPRKGA